MNSDCKKYELLAPAGSIEQLKAAVNNGCDSVYLGLSGFNARMKAPNFTEENIREWIEYCHFFNVKVYITVNTSVKNDEFKDALKTLMCAYDNNADGVIVTDLALMKIASSLPKPFEIAASTQLNVHDRYGAEFVKKLGATTVVCARECSLEDIKDIASVGLKVESFIHGALCVCQSGQCLFSSMVGGNSGNRGLCAQPCRKKYRANSGAEGYLLSARDMIGVDAAENLIEAGASVFKIEGRGRRAEYAGLTSSVYKKLFENGFKIDDADKNSLFEMFNREMSAPAYLYKENGGIIYPPCQNHSGIYVGTVKNNKKGFDSSAYIYKGDGLKVFDNGREVGGGVAMGSGKGFVSAEFSAAVKDGMSVHRTTSAELCRKVLSAVKTKFVSFRFVGVAGQYAKLYATCENVTVSVESDYKLEKAIKIPVSEEELTLQLKKNGNPLYTISDIDIETDGIFMAKSQINELRRRALDKLTERLKSEIDTSFEYRKHRREPIAEDKNIAKFSGNFLSVICRTEEEVSKCILNKEIKHVIYKPSFISERELQFLWNCDKVYLDIPSFADLNYLEKLFSDRKVNVVCHNVGHIEFARKHGLKFIVGSGLNVFNDETAALIDDAETFVYSQELTFSEIARFKAQNGMIFADGELVLMKLVHCPFKVAYGCSCDKCAGDSKLTYTDELGNIFYLKRRRDARCTFELINGKKLSAVGKLAVGGRYLVDYDIDVLKHYAELNVGKQDGYAEKRPFTRGRLYSKIN